MVAESHRRPGGVAGSVGLVGPAAKGIFPAFTPAAAGGLALTVVRTGFPQITRHWCVRGARPPPLVLSALCPLVVCGRMKWRPLGWRDSPIGMD